LIARHVEISGIATLCLSSALDITKSVNPPRAAFLDYPLGHTTGKFNNPQIQREILLETIKAFSEITTPGTITMLPFEWEKDDSWKDTAVNKGDGRLTRDETPQYQYEEDRIIAEKNHRI